MVLLNKFVQWLSATKFWKKSIQFLGGTRLFPKRTLKLVKLENQCGKGPYGECLDIIQKGDIVLNNINDLLNNIVIPGKYGHIGMYIGDNKIIDTRGLPVGYKGLEKMFYADTVVILRPQVSEEYIDKMIEEIKKYLGQPYDYEFRFDLTTGVYCSELVYRADIDKLLGIPVKERFGIKSITPDDFLNLPKLKLIKKW